jgi:flagellar biosynthetic protein FlhB
MRLDLFSERSEPATPRRRQEARRRGQVAVSRDLTAAVSLLVLSIFFLIWGPSWLGELATSFGLMVGDLGQSPFTALADLGGSFAALAIVPLALAFAVTLMTGFAQTGLLLRPAALIPDFTRLNPAAGLQRLFSRQALVQAGKSLLELVLLGVLAFTTLSGLVPTLLNGAAPAGVALAVFQTAAGLAVKLAVVYLLLAVFDYAFQRRQMEQRLRMTRAEVREEARQTEGAPEVRRQQRQRQRRLSRQRMMAAVRTAQVVVTNPTHLAVALRYVHGVTPAPVVVAKGRGFMAERIKEEATRHGVEIVQNPPLAQALYRGAEVGDAIPPDLYRVVAELLAVIFRKRGEVP